MKYGMTFIVDLYDVDNDQEHHVLAMPGDYIRMSEWYDAQDLAGTSETVANMRRNYAIAWFALKRRGKLAEMGLPEELTVAAVDAMADRFTNFVNDVEDGSLPLREEPAR